MVNISYNNSLSLLFYFCPIWETQMKRKYMYRHVNYGIIFSSENLKVAFYLSMREWLNINPYYNILYSNQKYPESF